MHIQRGCITKIRIYYASTKQSEKKSGILEEIVISLHEKHTNILAHALTNDRF